MTLFKKGFIVIILAIFTFSFTMPSPSAYASPVLTQPVFHDIQNSIEEEQLINLLSVIEEMPDSVINEGTESINAYIFDEVGLSFGSSVASPSFSTSSIGDVASCTGAVGYALVSNFTPAKILKIKSALKTVGGATKFVKALSPYYKMSREDGLSKTSSINQAVRLASKDAGPDTREALLDLFGISSIIGTCSVFFEK